MIGAFLELQPVAEAALGQKVSHSYLLSSRSDRQVWKVVTASGGIVVCRTCPLGYKADIERIVSKLASDSGIGPKLLCCAEYSEGKYLICEEFISDEKPFSDDRMAEKVALQLRTFYSADTSLISQVLPREFSLPIRLRAWISEAKTLGLEGIWKMHDLLPEIEELWAASAPTLIHGDLRPQNILVASGNVRFIDFEHASVGDPRYDVAKLTLEGFKDGSSIERLLHACFSLSSETRRAVNTYAKVHQFAVAVWMRRNR